MEQEPLASLVAQRAEGSDGLIVPWRVVVIAILAASVLFLLPGDLRHKAHLLLQGVCAQRPSHSILFGGQPLPVDARMTGIYLGGASSLLWYQLVWRGGLSGRFTRVTWGLVTVMIASMVGDGLNALGTDLGWATPYAPNNGLRLVTGLLSGVAIGTVLSHLATLSLTSRPPGGWPVTSARALLAPLLMGAALGLLAATGLPTLALPLTWLLIGAAVAVLWAMTSVVVALALGRSWGFASARQRDETLALALVAACGLLLVLAGLRTLLEQMLGPLRLP